MRQTPVPCIFLAGWGLESAKSRPPIQKQKIINTLLGSFGSFWLFISLMKPSKPLSLLFAVLFSNFCLRDTSGRPSWRLWTKLVSTIFCLFLFASIRWHMALAMEREIQELQKQRRLEEGRLASFGAGSVSYDSKIYGDTAPAGK